MFFINYNIEMTHGWIQAIAPKPLVFLNKTYYQEKVLKLYTRDQKVIEIDFKSNHTWPFKNLFMATYYPLLRVLDRPDISNAYDWNYYVDFFICRKQGNVFKDDFIKNHFIYARAFIKEASGKWILVQEYQCK